MNLTSQNICDTFDNVLNVGTAAGDIIPASGRTTFSDGKGNCAGIRIGRTGNGAGICGNLDVCGDITTTNGGEGKFAGCVCSGSSVRGTSLCSTGTFRANGTGTITGCATFSTNTCVGGILTVGGCIRGCSDIVAFYSSDRRLKENLNVIDSSSIVNGLTGYTFDWTKESEREGHDFGVMAQDLQQVAPELVHERDNGYLAVDYIKLIPVLVEEVKRLNQEVEELKAKI